jgi:hypothetical protein
MDRVRLGRVPAAIAIALAILGSRGAGAETKPPERKPQNLKILKDTGWKSVNAAMKDFKKGLGVKCTTCHPEGEGERDDLPAKEEARKFFAETVGVRDAAKREGALRELLARLKRDKADDPALLWRGVDALEKK